MEESQKFWSNTKYRFSKVEILMQMFVILATSHIPSTNIFFACDMQKILIEQIQRQGRAKFVSHEVSFCLTSSQTFLECTRSFCPATAGV